MHKNVGNTTTCITCDTTNWSAPLTMNDHKLIQLKIFISSV